ncbi:hypothetical protein EV13_1771 [Prochlorococcus sp. MIT 0702]|nr:hypothetical protein EV12_1492 [Prochlorococcus sp. MIT 0701]KGG27878.1 hypothetical protein EV13_1771 [Prochlorococcus sp. MIT 0702]KGG31399.1 hypothetical protein EV14_2350 [Prochlorococcus sp. MIT 0703]
MACSCASAMKGKRSAVFCFQMGLLSSFAQFLASVISVPGCCT